MFSYLELLAKNHLKVGITGNYCTTEPALLEHCVRDELNKSAPRRLVVIDPIELNILNFKKLNLKSKVEVANHPANEAMGKRSVGFSEKLFIGQFQNFEF